MDFGEALRAMHQQQRVCREGWFGHGIWVCYMDPQSIPLEKVSPRVRAFLPHDLEGPVRFEGYFVIFGVRGGWRPGWAPTQEDLEAGDWMVMAPPDKPELRLITPG